MTDDLLPLYQCHKRVRAAKVLAVSDDPDTAQTHLTLEGVGPAVQVPYFNGRARHFEVGGYFVQYDDGYTSWSPAKAFEEGYTLVDADELVDHCC